MSNIIERFDVAVSGHGFDCLVRPKEGQEQEVLAIEYWTPAPVGYPKNGCRGMKYSSFEEYLEALMLRE